MAEIEKLENSPDVEIPEKRKFTFLVFLACVLSVGSLAYSTYSFLDLNKIEALPIAILGGVSLVGLSAAAAMDIFWSATMVAEYRGRKVMWSGWPRKKKKKPKNILPLIGWLEVLAIAGMLAYHGQQMGGWAAAFTAILPIVTKFTWVMALDDIRDPAELTEEEKEEIAALERQAKLRKQKLEATQKDHEAVLEELRRERERELEAARIQSELRVLEKRTEFDIQRMEKEQGNELKALDMRLKAGLQMDEIRWRRDIEAERDAFDFEVSLRRPRPATIQGQVMRPGSTLEIESGTGDGDEAPPADLTAFGLSVAEQKKAEIARMYYAVDAEQGGAVTKAQFAKAIKKHPSRVTEATQQFPIEWFVENGLATWMESQG